MMIKLKPCPFCGKEISVCAMDWNKYGVERLTINCCMKFDIESDEVLTTFNGKGLIAGFDAVQKWNRRAGEQDELRS